MYDDFVMVGVKADPAAIAGGSDAPEALQKIAAAKALFASRGDNSGTHKAVSKLQQQAGIDPKGQGWYRERGSARARR